MECNSTIHRVNFINEYPIALNMAVKRPFPFAMKRVVTAFLWERLFVDDIAHYGLIVGVQIHQHFFMRIVQFGWNFTPHHGSAFLNGGYSLGIVARISGYRISVRSADGTFAFKLKSITCGYLRFGNRGKRKNNPPRRYFGGYVNNQPVGIKRG